MAANATAGSSTDAEPPRRRDLALPAPAQGQPGRLAAVGRAGARGGARARRAAARLDRLLGLPLVPRDGARVVRGPRRRGLHERALRLRQGRSRGAPRRRRDLHGRGAGDDRPRRLAAERVRDAGAGAVLRRHVLPAGGRATGCPSWRQLLEAIVEAWTQRARRDPRAGARRSSRTSARRAQSSPTPASRSRGLLDDRRRGDRGARRPGHGGFGGAPKFPQASRDRAAAARAATRDAEPRCATLRAMARGGIYDQLGGGFARYAVDAAWVVPHFEKMLYDNALLARAYLHGWQVGGERAAAARLQRDARLGAARDARAGGRLRLRAGRRLRGRRGQVLRLDAGRAARGARRRARRRRGRALRRRARRATSRARTSSCAPARTTDPPELPEIRRRLMRRARSSACGRGSTTSAWPPGTR